MAKTKRTETLTIRISPQEFDTLKLYSEKEEYSISDAVRALMAEKLAYYRIDNTIEKKGDFSNNQVFKVGQKVEFYCKPKSGDKFAGIHTVKRFELGKDGVARIQTDISLKVAEPKDLMIAVHWFRPVKK